MPVQYADGIMAEHKWTRENAGAFDVSHMGPCFLILNDDLRTGDGDADHAAVAALVEPLIPGDIAGLKRGQIRYTVLLNAEGGMIDDLMIARPWQEERQGLLYIVVNAGGKETDFAIFEKAAAGKASLLRVDDRALIALQGPKAAAVVAGILPEAAELTFMTHRRIEHQGREAVGRAVGLHRRGRLRNPRAHEDGADVLGRPSGGRAGQAHRSRRRDSLRLEAGLPLYGHDADETVSPVEANLAFAVSRRRRREESFPGAARIERELSGELTRLRVGLLVEGAPAREGAEIADADGTVIGKVTSGGFSPTLARPIAMGFVPPAYAAAGTALNVVVRGRTQAATVTSLPFVPHNYVRKA